MFVLTIRSGPFAMCRLTRLEQRPVCIIVAWTWRTPWFDSEFEDAYGIAKLPLTDLAVDAFRDQMRIVAPGP